MVNIVDTSGHANGEPPTVQFRVIGLDLGQQADFTALCLLEWERPRYPLGPLPRPDYNVRTLKRWPLGTSYVEVVEGLVKFYGLAELRGAVLVADATGCGRPVVDMLAMALVKAKVPAGGLVAVTITGGHKMTLAGSGEWHVPKKTLVSVLQVLLQTRRLHVAPELPEAATLLRELSTFKVKVSPDGHETFESWRERDHDDLVFAVCLSCWAAETLDTFRPAPPPPPTRLVAW